MHYFGSRDLEAKGDSGEARNEKVAVTKTRDYQGMTKGFCQGKEKICISAML